MHRGAAIQPHLHLIFPTEFVEVHKQHLSWCGIERDLEHYKLHESKKLCSLERMSVPVAICFIGVNQGVWGLCVGIAQHTVGSEHYQKMEVKSNCCTFLQYQQMALFPSS